MCTVCAARCVPGDTGSERGLMGGRGTRIPLPQVRMSRFSSHFQVLRICSHRACISQGSVHAGLLLQCKTLRITQTARTTAQCKSLSLHTEAHAAACQRHCAAGRRGARGCRDGALLQLPPRECF